LCTLSVFLARHHLFLYTHFPVPFFIIAHAKQTTIQPSLCPLSRVSNFVWARISRQTRWLKMSDEWGTTRVLWIRELGILSECLWALVRISRTYARSSSDKRNFGRVGRSFCAEQAPNALSKKVTFHKESSHCVAISHVWMCGRMHMCECMCTWFWKWYRTHQRAVNCVRACKSLGPVLGEVLFWGKALPSSLKNRLNTVLHLYDTTQHHLSTSSVYMSRTFPLIPQRLHADWPAVA
jgi:hypothetical protein